MNDPFKTNNKLGLQFTESVTQTLLPIVCGGNGKIQGFFTIASTMFDGSETTFELAEGEVPLKSVTLPDSIDDGTGFGVKQYMAAYWDPKEELKEPWRGYSAYVNTNDTGYVMRHYMPTQGSKTIVNRGTLVTALLVDLDTTVPIPAKQAAPTATSASLSWASTVKVNSAQLQCGFFDFNWVTLFKAKFGQPKFTKVMQKAALALNETSVVTITFSEPVLGFSSSNLTATGGTLGSLTTTDDKTWSAVFTATEAIADTSNSVSVNLTGVIGASKSVVPNPVRLEVVSNPVGGEFKSTLVPYPTLTANGAVEFNTVRIIKLKNPAIGAYTFTYKVYDDQNQSTTCTLTLNIVN